CTIAHHPTENGDAEPQSMDRNRSQSFGISNGGTMCLVLFQQSKNAPMVTHQSPTNHARTSSLLPDDRSRCLYAATSMCWLLSTRDGMKTRSSPDSGSRMIRFPRGAGSM